MTKLRLYFVFGICLLGFSLVLFRAFQLQVLPDSQLKRMAQRQLNQRIEIVGRRGTITDRNGKELSVSTNSASLFANPILIKNIENTAKQLAPIIGINQNTLIKKIQTNSQKKFIWIKRQLTRIEIDHINKLNLKNLSGIGMLPEYRREYPQGTLGSHLLGFVSLDGKGLEGVEKVFDQNLTGETNSFYVKRDALGRPIFSNSDQVRWNYQRGSDLELTIDSKLQFVAENALEDAIKHHQAEAGTVIVMDPTNGEILALANFPFFDPNSPNLSPRSHIRNRAISDPIEPGSTLKPFVVARAIEEKKVTPKTILNTHGGQLKIGRHTISESDKKHYHPKMSVNDIIRYSSNVGSVVIKNLIGFTALRDTYEKLGFSSTSGIELLGESRGLFPQLSPKQLLEEATISFGQGIALTPIQLLRAFSVFANGGYLVRPTLVRRLDGKSIERRPEEFSRIFSPETASTMNSLLEQVVEQEGTGRLAKIDGFTVGGKTATAQRVDFSRGGYEARSYWSSFVGYAPSKNPRFVIYVMIDRPRKNGYYGGIVAAPVFSKIVREALRLSTPAINISAQVGKTSATHETYAAYSKSRINRVNATQLSDQIPDIQGLSIRSALRTLEDYPLEIETVGTGYRVKKQIPEAGAPLPKNAKLKIYVD